MIGRSRHAFARIACSTRAQYQTIRRSVDAMTDQELRGLLADLGTVVVSETGVRIRYLPELEPLIAGAELPVPRGRGWAKRV